MSASSRAGRRALMLREPLYLPWPRARPLLPGYTGAMRCCMDARLIPVICTPVPVAARYAHHSCVFSSVQAALKGKILSFALSLA